MYARTNDSTLYDCTQDKTSREQISEYKRELELVTEERDSFQEQLQSSGWQREEGEREEGEGEENAGERSSDLLQQISLVEEMNLKATAGIKETKQKAKVCVCVCVPARAGKCVYT